MYLLVYIRLHLLHSLKGASPTGPVYPGTPSASQFHSDPFTPYGAAAPPMSFSPQDYSQSGVGRTRGIYITDLEIHHY